MALGKESYFWHKLHSLTGIIPVGFYMVQHLTLNSFAFAGPEKYNSVIHFFEGVPKHVLWALKIGVILIPLLFHAIYGIFIISRSSPNYSNAAYKFRENRYYMLQRMSGIAAFAFLIYHYITAPIAAQLKGAETTILYDNWADKLSSYGYLVLAFYVIGVVSSSYHFAYGIWNFCIRWGITISEKAQMRMAKVSAGIFVAVAGLGILSLIGFFWTPFASKEGRMAKASLSQPLESRTITAK